MMMCIQMGYGKHVIQMDKVCLITKYMIIFHVYYVFNIVYQYVQLRIIRQLYHIKAVGFVA
jgi:hypothetical protein